MVLNKLQHNRGISLVEVIVVSAIMLIVFGGLLISFRYSLELISHSRAKLTALTLANDGMEYIRSLSYNAVGTVSGIPSGLIPQVSTTTLNGIQFTKRVLVEYVDSAADGLAGADSNGIITDYKRAKVTLEWTLRGVTKEVFLVSTIIPRSIETDVDGGTVRVNVFTDTPLPLPGADVRLINSVATTAVDVTRSSDALGVALFGGAPKGGGYELIVTAPGYSTDRTYVATTSMPNPVKFPFAVIESSIATMNMFIDRLSSVTVTSLASKTNNQITVDFSASSSLATSTNVAISSGQLRLQGASGTYSLLGTAFLNQVVPVPLSGWDYLVVEGSKSANTNVLIRFYTGSSSPYTIIPDSALPGNSSGFSIGAINVSGLNPLTYPVVTLGVTLNSTNSNETPSLDTTVLGYVSARTPLTNRTLTLTGQKVIGYRADTSPVFKTVLSTTTGSLGVITYPNFESDIYTAGVTNFDIAEICEPTGLTVAPGVTKNIELVFATDSANSLRTVVRTAGGTPIIGAQVTVTQGAFSASGVTKSCGQVFVSGLTAAADYTITVTATGYTTQIITPINVSGDVLQNIVL